MSFDTSRVCSLRAKVEIVPADISAWRCLGEFHYRPGRPGAIDKIFALRLKGRVLERKGGKSIGVRLSTGGCRPVGVIVYSMPIPRVALRNQATNGRYLGLGDRRLALQRLNREMRWISRVVVHPQYRGIGLASLLVRQTLPLAGTAMVEAMAAMGRVNPFFERAGMSRFERPLSSRSVRLLDAFAGAGIKSRQLVDPDELVQALEALPADRQAFLDDQMRRFARSFRHPHAPARTQESQRALLARWVAEHALLNPVYYLWTRP